MILTILGIILFLIPLLLVFCFKDKTTIFLYVVIFSFAFHLFLALVTQALHIFTYPVIITTNILVTAGVLFFMFKFRNNFSKIKINWLLILAIAIISFELWTIHNFYTGPVNTIKGPSSVVKSAYTYPYFSDEWIGASLESYSIKNHSLPSVNPLNANKPFKNPMLAFFSVVSEFFLLFNLDPITHTSTLSIFTAIFVCLSIYLLLRSAGINNLISTVTILGIPFITNGANLPGIWYLMPFIISLIFFVFSLIGLNLKEEKLFWVASFLSLLVYPPMIIFIIPTLIVCSFVVDYFNKSLKKFFINLIFVFCAGFFISVFVLLAGKYANFIKNIWSYIFRLNLDGGTPSFAIWNIIPIVFLPFVFIGVARAFKNKMYYILAPVFTGLVFWVLYATVIDSVFIIEYTRVVVITSILLMFFSGFGLEYVINELKQKYVVLNRKVFKSISITVVFLFFALLSLFYPVSENWRKLVLNIDSNNNVTKITPAAPINRYLTQDDLRLFNSISNKRFVAPPWKGLVIGVATGNYPLESKPSTISNKILLYKVFNMANCGDKAGFAKKYHIDYVYADNFQCDGFNFIDKSSEGLSLYKVEL